MAVLVWKRIGGLLTAIFVREQRGGAPDVRCAWPSCKRMAVSYELVPGFEIRYVCECCGFSWRKNAGTDAKGNNYLRDHRGGWTRVR